MLRSVLNRAASLLEALVGSPLVTERENTGDLSRIGIHLPPQLSRTAFLETGNEHEDQRLLELTGSYQAHSSEGSLC